MYQGRFPVEFRDRAKKFAAAAIRLHVRQPKTREEAGIVGKQLLGSGTSVAARVREASRARSDEEFLSKTGGALQEADESALWLELLREECGVPQEVTLPMEKEADEHIAKTATMINRTKGKRWIQNIARPEKFLLSAFQIPAFL
jgi:four helix bundle protein